MNKKKKYFSTTIMALLLGIHLYIFIMELIPRTLYPTSITLNYISLFFLVEVAIVTVFFLLKHQQHSVAIILFHIILLIPAVIIFKIDISCSESSTKDIHSYLRFDENETLQVVSKYFPTEINENDVENYSYFYETTDIIFYAGTNVEVCLELKYNKQEYGLEVERLSNLYTETKLDIFKINNRYAELCFIDNIDYSISTIRNGLVKKILFNEEKYSITYVYLKIEDKIDVDELFYFKNMVDNVKSV